MPTLRADPWLVDPTQGWDDPFWSLDLVNAVKSILKSLIIYVFVILDGWEQKKFNIVFVKSIS